MEELRVESDLSQHPANGSPAASQRNRRGSMTPLMEDMKERLLGMVTRRSGRTAPGSARPGSASSPFRPGSTSASLRE